MTLENELEKIEHKLFGLLDENEDIRTESFMVSLGVAYESIKLAIKILKEKNGN